MNALKNRSRNPCYCIYLYTVDTYVSYVKFIYKTLVRFFYCLSVLIPYLCLKTSKVTGTLKILT